MKKRFIAVLLTAIIMASFCVGPVSAAAPPFVKKAIRVSDIQIVIEFSEPIEFSFQKPFIALRLVNGANALQMIEGTPLQIYNGLVEFIDDKHDRILWTCYDSDAVAMMDLTGTYANFPGCTTKLCIEELPPNNTDTEDGTVHNIQSVASGLKLIATYTGAGTDYDGVYVNITKDYNYVLPVVESSAASSGSTGAESSAASSAGAGDESSPSAPNSVFNTNPASDKIQMVEYSEKTNIAVYILSGLLLLSVALNIYCLLKTKKQKAGK